MPTPTPTRPSAAALAAAALVTLCACADESPGTSALRTRAAIHLEDRLASARVVGSEAPAERPAAMEWSFDRVQPDWRPVRLLAPGNQAAIAEPVEGALRLRLTAEHGVDFGGRLLGALAVELPPGARRSDWSSVEIRARTSHRLRSLGLGFNLDPDDPLPGDALPFHTTGEHTPLVTDGTVQTYQLSVDVTRRALTGPWTHLGFWFNAQDDVDSGALDLLSIRLVPREDRYASDGTGVLNDWKLTEGESQRDSPYRRTLFTHAPSELVYPLLVPEGGRLDLGLGVAAAQPPMRFRVSATPAGGERELLLDESLDDTEAWALRSVDLSAFAGREIELELSAESSRAGAAALWSSPTLSGARRTRRPNVILYVIDGASPDYMSVYGYNRRTTPRLEELAQQGALFERAYSNSAWTRPSTASFVTSLQHSVLGGLRNGRNPVPEDVPTLAEHLRRAGYQTAVFTSNSNAGRMSRIDRGTDAFRDAGVDNWSTSSVDLHGNFWRWREDFPAEPYFVHFQPTDVHNDHTPVAPFSGLFIDPERRRTFEDELESVNATPEGPGFGIREALDSLGIDQASFWTANRDLHDESMAHQDHRLGELVDQLKARGEWEHTLLIVAADHGIAAGAWDYRLLLRDPQPKHIYHDDRAVPMVRRSLTRIPLIVVWPERIARGQRFSQPVSMIDALPTILALADLPMPEMMMGQSLAPLLLGERGWEPRPVILDELEHDPQTGERHGRIEMVDGRWGASLEIGWDPERPPARRRPAPLLVFDLLSDPDCLDSLHERRPDLVAKYDRLLHEQWEAHQSLASQLTRAEDAPLTPEQLETLRALGYIQ